MRRALCIPVLVLAALGGVAAGESASDLDKWIADLGNANFAAREAASAALEKAGEAARAKLQAALRSDDPEVQTRARALLDGLEARRGKENPPDPRLSDPAKELDDMLRQMERMQRQAFQGLPRALLPAGGGVLIDLNLNGKRVKLTERDLKSLEGLKGEEVPGLGIRASACPEELASQLKVEGGVLVREGPENAPGIPLERHDVVVAAAGAAVRDPDALERLAEAGAGKPLELTVFRKGERRTVSVTPKPSGAPAP